MSKFGNLFHEGEPVEEMPALEKIPNLKKGIDLIFDRNSLIAY